MAIRAPDGANKRGREGVRMESENENIKTGKKRHRKKHRELLS